MARYVTLFRFTPKGVSAIKESPDRATAFQKHAEKAGLKVELQLWTTGRFDGILIVSGDEKQVLGSIARLAAAGNVQTETLQAFDAGEFSALIQ